MAFVDHRLHVVLVRPGASADIGDSEELAAIDLEVLGVLAPQGRQFPRRREPVPLPTIQGRGYAAVAGMHAGCFTLDITGELGDRQVQASIHAERLDATGAVGLQLLHGNEDGGAGHCDSPWDGPQWASSDSRGRSISAEATAIAATATGTAAIRYM
ncbi:hypothetical protein D3C78_1489790 [compost metagenome]